MNPQRLVFLELARVPIPWPEWDKDFNPRMSRHPEPTDLCAFCRYARFDGYCQETETRCEHSLMAVRDRFDYRMDSFLDGRDCWGFRPRLPVEIVAEWVGQRLQGKMVELP